MTTGNLLGYPRFKGESSTGVALAGGLLYTYESGTTTPKATYSDVDCLVDNTNPVVLNSAGEAVIWLSGEYTLVLKDSLGVQQWSMDDIVGWSTPPTVTAAIEAAQTAAEAAEAGALIAQTAAEAAEDGAAAAATAAVAAVIEDTAYGTSWNGVTDKAPSKNAVYDAIELSSLVGNIIMRPVGTVPAGYLECNGASLLRASYPALFDVIEDAYGAADATHFNLPDYRGKFLRGWDHGAGVDPDAATRTAPAATGATIAAGDYVGTEQAQAYLAHTHSYTYKPFTGSYGAGTGSGVTNPGSSAGTTGSTGGTETRPINTTIMFCIKY